MLICLGLSANMSDQVVAKPTPDTGSRCHSGSHHKKEKGEEREHFTLIINYSCGHDRPREGTLNLVNLLLTQCLCAPSSSLKWRHWWSFITCATYFNNWASESKWHYYSTSLFLILVLFQFHFLGQITPKDSTRPCRITDRPSHSLWSPLPFPHTHTHTHRSTRTYKSVGTSCHVVGAKHVKWNARLGVEVHPALVHLLGEDQLERVSWAPFFRRVHQLLELHPAAA